MEEEPVTQPGQDDNGLAQILAEVVEEVRLSIDRDTNGADLLYSLLSAPWLYSLLRVYECLVQHSQDAPSPYLPYSSRLSQEIMVSVRGLAAPSSEAQELYILLKRLHVQALLSAHDSVAQRDYGPVVPPLPDKLPDNEEAMRIVCLVKNKQPLCVKEGKPSYWNSLRRLTVEKLALARLFGSGGQSLLGSEGGLSSSTSLLSSIPSGQPHSLPSTTMQLMQVFIMPDQKQGATIRKNERTGNIFIARVIHGGLADRSGLLHPGDKLVEVNGQKVQGLQPERVIQMLLYVRPMVDYSPLQDPAIPCPDAGMAYSKGDLLEIVDQRDIRCKQRELWWSQPYQAHTCIRP
ncbi:hypothetical protein cypCar_00017968 [Cyprinus carpio]|nr:hypothetical protein cypCar_00017968 [Cyprinus carpio]